MNLINCIIVLIVTTTTIATAPTIDVVVIIQSPNAQHHAESSKRLKKDILKQSKELQSNFRIKVHLLHEIFNCPGGWTIHNLIPQLMSYQRKQHLDDKATTATAAAAAAAAAAHKLIDKDVDTDVEIINDNTRWIIFCEDKTQVKLKLLIENLNKENHVKPLFLGYPLYDREPTIIHHFAFFENPKWFPYPMLCAGVIFSLPLIKSIAETYNNQNIKQFKQQFSIDAGHELARFIYDNIHVPLTTVATTTAQHTSENVNCLNQTSSPTLSNMEKTTSLPSTTGENIETLHNPSSIAGVGDGGGGTANISFLSSTDFRTMTTNETKDIYETETFKPSGDKKTTTTATITTTTAKTKASIIKKQKIILKKASYICPTATWEGSISSSSKSIKKNDNESCAMYAEQTVNPVSTMTCAPVRREEIYFAVKTCSKYHNERLPVIQATWASYAKHIKYFSDKQDNLIPTLSTGVPNVEMGHCAKTLKILQMALEDIEGHNKKLQNVAPEIHRVQQEDPEIKWLFLSDDDTLLSISGVCQVLGCYNSMDEIYLGERYGYRLFAQDGFNYITGGGGIAFSLPAVKLILQHCSCPSSSAPDDMILGSCLHSLQLKAVHSSRFHQARPNDYPRELLQQEPPVSFHKFWQLDPFDVYKEWFAVGDHKLFGVKEFDFESIHTDDYHFKTGQLLSKKQPLNLHKMPVSIMNSVHHSKERHIEL